MSIIVEDGTGLANATAYVSLAEANAYFELMGMEVLEEADDTVIIRASQAVDQAYGARYRGTKLKATQALSFPRVAFTDADGFERSGIPAELKKAVYEAVAQLQAGTELVTNPTRDGLVTKSTKKIGTLEITQEFADTQTSTSKNTKIDLILRPILLTNVFGLRNIKLNRG